MSDDPVISPAALAAALEILRLAGDPTAMQERIRLLAAAANRAAEREAAAVAEQSKLVAARQDDLATVAAANAAHVRDHAARIKELERREAKLAGAQAELEAERERVKDFERSLEVRASDLSNRMGHRGLDAA